MMFIEKDGMKFLETIKKKIKIGGITPTNLKKKVMQTIDFIKQFINHDKIYKQALHK